MPKTKKRSKRPQRRTRPLGWSTSDTDEIERRRARGQSESLQITPLSRLHDFFGDYRVESPNGQTYQVEIRSLSEPINSCDCPDHRINGLGTCKHVEATLNKLQYRRKRAYRDASDKGSPFIEIFPDRRDHQVLVRWPGDSRRPSKAWDLIAPFFTDNHVLASEPLDKLPALLRLIEASHGAVRRRIRVSNELRHWLETLDRREQRTHARHHYETQVAAGKASLDTVKCTLYPYQHEGMLHLAFTGRALLADEMGLGKTVQAIAACELLRRIVGIQRVLVIAPASLKGEWEDQIAKFTDLPSHIIQGARAKRLRQYEEPAFFSLANYEQIRPDVEAINAILAPDVIILDEAQRIKNWQTQTAISIKRLQSPYTFVLTGTPLENRIDEIYSIAQFLDPQIFGPLFRFNREFYQLDEKGRAIGYQNLDRLHERLRPVMLRRRKEEVEGQLPGRTVNTYFVPMHDEQTLRYEEYEARVARIAATARSRPLKKEEMERLQQYLACMRMLCDTPYILDQNCRIAPKLKELSAILQELSEDGDHKIIIFSEWQRMLELVRVQAKEMGLGHAWHTGQVPQPKRREEIRRFKQDPECRLFLSTDSGAVGLNLQVADVVINLDLPWNPAKLEQRIARAWRKHQKRPVQVINLVSEHTIEHRMLSLLEQKRSLAAGVVDGKGDKEMRLPSGRAAFLERLDALMTGESKAPQTPSVDPFECLRDDALVQWRDQLELMELHGEEGQQTLLVVTDRLDEALRSTLTRQLEARFPDRTPQLKLLDREAYATIQQLIQAGILSANRDSTRALYNAPTDRLDEKSKQLNEAREQLARSEHKRRMSQVLKKGGFAVEALAPMQEAVETALHALALWHGRDAETPPDPEWIDAMLVQQDLLPAETLSLISNLREDRQPSNESSTNELLTLGDNLLSQAASLLE
ncbi:MAG: DEAD/DEAH box helicase [Candidatus Thiodiazotropha sp. (ex Epidulcina cf. delphinae)]|nr:DEAD/DEAH box helicase [Candidatus Thiodiazotropha sp. (ex Epidulcina cf. delphinae)]